MARWRLKGCPRCGGDMLLDRDMDFWFEQCLQCSYRVELGPLNKYCKPVKAGNIEDKIDSESESEN